MTSISHITLGSNDLMRSARFYDAVMATLDFARLPKPAGKPPAYQRASGEPIVYIYPPLDGAAATVGNGSHVAFFATSKAAVHAFHETALAMGGCDAGEPGPRPHYGLDYYASYVRDPDGNKLQAVYIGR